MLRLQFETLLPKEVTRGIIRWMGFSRNGTLAYGILCYKSGQKVKVYRASVFGSVHEIADIEFAHEGWKSEIFYTQRQEFAWIHQVNENLVKSLSLTLVSSLVIFSVESGELKRYYAEENITGTRFVRAIDDVMVVWRYTSNYEADLFEIQLDSVHETFSVDFLVRVDYDENSQNLEWCTFYNRDYLGYCDLGDFDFLSFYHFKGRHWHSTNVTVECQSPDEHEEKLRGMFNGRSFYYIANSTDRVRQLTLDYGTLTWKEIFTDNQIPMERAACYASKWLATSDGQTVCSFAMKRTTTAESVTTWRITVHCRKNMPLKELCLSALWHHVHGLYPELQCFTDHELCEILTLSSVFNADIYFGRNYTPSL